MDPPAWRLHPAACARRITPEFILSHIQGRIVASGMHLPSLPFGAGVDRVFSTAASFGDAIAPVVDGLEAIEFDGPRATRRGRMSGIRVRDVGLMACAVPSGRAVIGANHQLAFGFTTSGDVTYGAGSTTYRDVRANDLLFGDSCPRTVQACSEASIVLMVVDRDRLLHTADAMTGEVGGAGGGFRVVGDLLARKSRLVALRDRRATMTGIFSGVFHAIDAVRGDAAALAAMAIDDHIHRLLVMLLAPEALQTAGVAGAGAGRAATAVDKACEFIEANLTDRITLTSLERLTGLGARALQIAFRDRLQCSPMEWLRRRRLQRVRSVLQSGDATTSIREVAARYGFFQDGQFARMYRRQFGERPSETVRRRRD